METKSRQGRKATQGEKLNSVLYIVCKNLFSAVVALLWLSGSSSAQMLGPILCFSDLQSGPRTGNSDT